MVNQHFSDFWSKIVEKLILKILVFRRKALTLHSLSGMNEISRGETEVIEILATKTKVVQRNSERQGKMSKEQFPSMIRLS